MYKYALVTVLGVSMCHPVAAQTTNCALTKNVKRYYTKIGLVQQTKMPIKQGHLETWANAMTGDWVIIQVKPNGLSCAMVSGKGFIRMPIKPNV